MMKETIRLMLTVAEQRMDASSALTHSVQARYAPGLLLRALAIQLLLKAALLSCGKRYANQTACADMWDELPSVMREKVLADAAREGGDLARLKDGRDVFEAYDQVVEAAEYRMDTIEEWMSASNQSLLRENLQLAAVDTPTVYPLEAGLLSAGLAAYVRLTNGL
jgi:hypothetical protein